LVAVLSEVYVAGREMAELTLSSRNLSVDDTPKIAAAISQLAKIRLKPLFPEREFPEVARRKVEELEGISIPDPPLPLTWIDLALTGSEQAFANAAHFQDHCFDMAGEGDYAGWALSSCPPSSGCREMASEEGA
jgi:hypothetical protein